MQEVACVHVYTSDIFVFQCLGSFYTPHYSMSISQEVFFLFRLRIWRIVLSPYLMQDVMNWDRTSRECTDILPGTTHHTPTMHSTPHSISCGWRDIHSELIPKTHPTHCIFSFVFRFSCSIIVIFNLLKWRCIIGMVIQNCYTTRENKNYFVCSMTGCPEDNHGSSTWSFNSCSYTNWWRHATSDSSYYYTVTSRPDWII